MLQLITSFSGISFSKLLPVYRQSLTERAQAYASRGNLAEQLAEEDFYQYLRWEFFSVPGARYAIWQEEEAYLSAARLEPYRDGLLLSGLETHPDYRGKGIAKAFLRALFSQEMQRPVYSHVDKKNLPSLRAHQALGFVCISDQAAYLDGSVDSRCCTLVLRDETL